MKHSSPDKIQLSGFNNLTKSLSFSIYDIRWTGSAEARALNTQQIDKRYSAAALTGMLADVCQTIGASVLNVGQQDYTPHGASATLLLAEDDFALSTPSQHSHREMPSSLVNHLDKSHICVHTYPESHSSAQVSTFRADIDIATCGLISPLKALPYLISCFSSEVVTIDYRIRGFTRDIKGHKHFIDHAISSIQDYLPADLLSKYQVLDTNFEQGNIFHSKMMKQEPPLDDLLVATCRAALPQEQVDCIKHRLNVEMQEIFYGRALSVS